MDVKMETAVGQLNVVGGVRQEQAANTLAVEPRGLFARGKERGNLYVLVELIGQSAEGEDFGGQLVDIAQQEYYSTKGSVTAGLRSAIKAINAFLFEENVNSPRDARTTGGISCVVLRGDDLYVAQAGPAAVYLAGRDRLIRFPEDSPWLGEDVPVGEDDLSVPLGVRRVIEPTFYHHEVEPGQTIIVAGSALARLVSGSQIAQAAGAPDIEMALARLEALCGGRDLSALVVRLGSESEVAEPKAVVAPVEARKETEETLDEWADTEETWVGVEETGEEETAGWGWGERLARWDVMGQLKRWGRGLVTALAVTLGGLGVLLRRIMPGNGESAEVEPVKPSTARRERRARRRPARKPRPERKRTEREHGPLYHRMLVAIAIAIPIIVIVTAAAVYWQRGQAHEAYYANLIQQAENKKAQAWASTDPATMRNLLGEALDHLAEASGLRPDDDHVLELQIEIERKLEEINHVEKLYWIGDLYEYGEAGSDPGRVIVVGIDVYVLDKGLDRVYKHLLNEVGDGLQQLDVSPILMRKGDQRDDIVVSELVDMVWMPTGPGRQTSNLLVLEQGGSLLQYDPSVGLTVLAVGGTDQWRYPQLLSSYFGRLYVLDTQANQIFRYVPTPNGYASPPENYLAAGVDVNFAGAVDMAIDGDIYVLYANGTIMRFRAGEPVPFEQIDIDEPLKAPTALYTAPDEETKFVYVADAGHQRIVQFDKEGRFIRQFKSAEDDVFDDLKGLYVDEIGGKFYVVSGNKLYLANIPTD